MLINTRNICLKFVLWIFSAETSLVFGEIWLMMDLFYRIRFLTETAAPVPLQMWNVKSCLRKLLKILAFSPETMLVHSLHLWLNTDTRCWQRILLNLNHIIFELLTNYLLFERHIAFKWSVSSVQELLKKYKKYKK